MTAQVSQIGKNQRPPRLGVRRAWRRYHPETDSQRMWSVRVQERRIHLLRRSTLPTSWWLPKSSLENRICRQKSSLVNRSLSSKFGKRLPDYKTQASLLLSVI